MDLQHHQRAVARAVALVCAAALAAPAASAAASPSAPAPAFRDGFGVRPVKRHGEAVAPSYFVLRAEPGERVEQSAVMWNASTRPIALYIDSVDGATGTTSGAVYANRADRRRETSRWIRPQENRVTLEPGERRRLSFRVRVPNDARPGEHLGGVAFQNADTVTTGARFTVRQVLRVVLGVEITVADGHAAQAELGEVALRALPGTQVPSAVIGLRNSGQLRCKPKLRIVVAGQGQQRAITQQLDTVLPGDGIAYPLALRGSLPAGRYDVMTAVDGCGAHRESSRAVKLATPLSGTTPQTDPQPLRASAPAQLPLWQLLAVLAGGICGGLLVALWWQRRHAAAPLTSSAGDAG